jgi:hypothetical protein
MFAYEFNEGRSVRLPIHRKAFKVLKSCIDAIGLLPAPIRLMCQSRCRWC